MRIVQKFGGTSLADDRLLLSAARQAAERAFQGDQVVVVVSARGRSTDALVCQGQQLLAEPPLREMEVLMSAGEQISAALMAIALEKLGCPAVSLMGWQMGLRTDSNFGNASVLGLDGQTVENLLQQGKVVVAAGFQGVDALGNITTLGRGGSDTTAVALAAFLGAEKCQIFTDVDGVYDRDPRRFPDARRFDRIGYDEMLALCRMGAQVLHGPCVELGKQYGVPIQVLSATQPGPGTLVGDTL